MLAGTGVKINRYEIIIFLLLYLLIFLFLLWNNSRVELSLLKALLSPLAVVIPVLLFYFIIKSLISWKKKKVF